MQAMNFFTILFNKFTLMVFLLVSSSSIMAAPAYFYFNDASANLGSDSSPPGTDSNDDKSIDIIVANGVDEQQTLLLSAQDRQAAKGFDESWKNVFKNQCG